ncbi:unconventional myosin-XVIIIb-like isoform X3 [Phycodurus eques]|uniref:unconventional myosin-XVIIIb-like isoform X3 n=1 Tax=Phycodurus eques TaxID=693459 RepID=UPI002ACE89F6|nr:unconventional myosin-XVIIIb-like isoform X3 [Phycodurus eques]
MALSSRLKLWEKKIQEENQPVVALVPPPPLSALPGGFLKQLVRDSEKETKQKEPDVKDEKPPSKLSDNLVQQFLLPDQTPPILEAEMLLRAEKHGDAPVSAHSPRPPSSQRSAALPGKTETRREVMPEPQTGGTRENEGAEVSLWEEEQVKTKEKTEERQEPEGRLAYATVTECDREKVKDVWYEAGTVWYVHKDGFTLATQLKPDEGTPDLPQGHVRLRLHADGSLLDVAEDHVDKCNPAHLDLCEDLSELPSINESGVLHALISRSKANMPLTHAGPDLVNLWPPLHTHSKTPKSRRGESWRDAPAALAALVKRVYVSMVDTRRDHCVCATGRSGTGKTATCQAFTVALLEQAGTVGPNVSVDRVQAMFTVLKSFGCVTSTYSDASSRFAMLFSLDFNHAGRAAAGHLQTIMLDKWRVCHTTAGESNFLVFSQMLVGLGTEMRTELGLHQFPERHSFGMAPPTKVEEKQRASVAFSKLLAAMETLAFSASEQKSIWHVLAGIYHLGAAGACKVGRRQFLNFDSAQAASGVLGCEGEELHTAVFKHHLRQLLQTATGGCRERNSASQVEDGPRLTAAQCVDGMASGLYEELFTTIVSLINRSLSGQQLALASVTVVDPPGLRNPRHAAQERAANVSEFCHNYLQERLLEHRYVHTFTHTMDRYAQEKIPVEFECPDVSPADIVSAIDQPPTQVRAAGDTPRGLLWALDEEMLTPASSEGVALERVCRHYSNTVRQCEQPLHCEVQHLTGNDAVRYDLTGWFGVLHNNPVANNAGALLHGSNIASVKSMFATSAHVAPLCCGVCGLEGSGQRSLQRNGTIRKTLSGGAAALRRHSPCIAVKLQADALVNVIRRARPVFLQCVSAKTDAAGAFDVAELRAQLKAAQTLAMLRIYRAGYPDHMTLSDFRYHFQALSPPIMKRYASMFVSHDERKAVDELLADLDQDPKSIVVGTSRVFMKRGVLAHLEAQRDLRVTGWLVHLQASCAGHLARHKYRTLKVQHMAVRCLQRNLRVLHGVSEWSWWKLFCRVRPLLDVNMDNERLRAKENLVQLLPTKWQPRLPPSHVVSVRVCLRVRACVCRQDEVSALRRRLEKSEKERNDLRQTVDTCETKLTAVTSELSDERFRGDAVGQALDVERAERLRLSKENKDLQARLDQCKVAMEMLEKNLEEERLKRRTPESRKVAGSEIGTESELVLKLECCQTEVGFLRRRLQQTEEKAEVERHARQQLDAEAVSLQAQLDESKRTVTDLKRQSRRVANDLHDAGVMTDSLRNRTHQLERKQRRFDGELAAALEDADSERELKDKTLQENTALGVQIFTLRRNLQESQAEACRLQKQKDELCSQIRDLSVHLTADSLPDLKKQVRHLERVAGETAQEVAKLTARIEQQQQVHMRVELEMARVKQMHQKELEDKEEELEDVHRSSQRRLRQLEMQLEQEYEEKQIVIHEKRDLEGLVATLCEQVGHRDFDVEKKLRRDLKRTHALLADAQTLLDAVHGGRQIGRSPDGGSKEQLERLHSQLEDSESRRRELESVQTTVTQELEDVQIELENIRKQKSLVDDEVCVLQREKVDLLKRLEEDQEDLDELMKKHKDLIAQSSSDICQIRELQAELEEVKKQRHALQEELQQQASRLQFLESSTVGRSIVSKQEARVCDLENKLEFQKGQVKRFEVLVLRLRDSVVRLGEELEQSAQSEARERENAHYFQQRLQDVRVEMDELSRRHQDGGRRRMELVRHSSHDTPHNVGHETTEDTPDDTARTRPTTRTATRQRTCPTTRPPTRPKDIPDDTPPPTTRPPTWRKDMPADTAEVTGHDKPDDRVEDTAHDTPQLTPAYTQKPPDGVFRKEHLTWTAATPLHAHSQSPATWEHSWPILEMQVEELTAIRQTLQADLETSIRRIVDLQAALEEVESSDDSDTDTDTDTDRESSVGTEDVGETTRGWRGAARGGSPSGSFRGQGGRRSAADSGSTYSFRSCSDLDEDDSGAGRTGGGQGRAASSSALSELLEGLRKRRAGGAADAGAGSNADSTVSLPVYQTTAASTLRRRASALSLTADTLPEARPGILKPSSPLLPRAASARSVSDPLTTASSATPSRFNSCDSLASLPSLPCLSSLASLHVARQCPPTRHPSGEHPHAQHPPSLAVPEEGWEEPQRSPQAPRRCALEGLLSEDTSEGPLAPEGAVFQNRHHPGESNTTSAILPAIRRARSAGSLAGSVRGGRRALSVHFGELPTSTRRRGVSDAESSGSGGSAESCESSRARGRSVRPQGERLEAEGSEGGEGGDVATVMRKYLNKESR